MAGGSTHLSSTDTGTENELGCFTGGKLTNDAFPVWTASVPSPGNPGIIFPDDEGGASASGAGNGPAGPNGAGNQQAGAQGAHVHRRIFQLKEIFHRGRHLLIKHLPPDVTQEEVRAVLPKNLPEVKTIVIPNSTDERERRGQHSHSITAKVFLADPTSLDGFQTVSTTVKVRDQLVSVTFCPSPTEAVLCVAHIPFSYTDQDFRNLVEKFGVVRSAFLMRSSRTGESKGYGFVEYEQKESAFMAKSCLDSRGPETGLSFDGFQPLTPTLSCDWLDSGIVSFANLESKCLCIRGLPPDFRDMSELRKVMSCHVNPPYCQIALKQGSPQDFGLVEFESADQTERTLEMRHGFTFHGKKLSVSYCIPGQRAINIYMKILHDHGNRGNSALLPDPTATSVVKRLQNLARNNPTFAQNLQNIILTQIHDIQEGAFKSPEEGDNGASGSHGSKWHGNRWNRGNKRHDQKLPSNSRWNGSGVSDMAVSEEEPVYEISFPSHLSSPGLRTDYAVPVSEASALEGSRQLGRPPPGWGNRAGAANSDPNASVLLLNSLLQAAEAASTNSRQNAHSAFPMAPGADAQIAAIASMPGFRDSFAKVINDPESLKQLMTIFQDTNGSMHGAAMPLPVDNRTTPCWPQQPAGFNGFQPQLIFGDKPPEISFVTSQHPGHLGAPHHALTGAPMEHPFAMIGAPWFAIPTPGDPSVMGFGVPPPSVASIVPWALQQVPAGHDSSAFPTAAAVVAAHQHHQQQQQQQQQQNALLRKRKLPPFGYPAPHPHSHGHVPMAADPGLLSAASFAFPPPDPFKRKRQF